MSDYEHCIMCGAELTEYMEEYKIYKPSRITGGKIEKKVCGRCFMLTSIKDGINALIQTITKPPVVRPLN